MEEAFEEMKESHTEIVNRMTKLKYNFEIIVYLLQGLVEVPQAPVATDYKDAILIKTKVIENENKEVTTRGDKNVDRLEKITQFKKNLYHETWKNDKLRLEIEDLKERAIDVQLYKVKKETQLDIIKGNNRTKDEDEKKRLDDRINSLQDNARARIEVISKKKKKLKNEINEKRKENNELETRARELQRNVDQRKQIMELRSKGTDDSVQDPTKRFKEIANIRKYREIVEQQKEEIEFLEDELERFRSRTFPSFANMHARQDYAD